MNDCVPAVGACVGAVYFYMLWMGVGSRSVVCAALQFDCIVFLSFLRRRLCGRLLSSRLFSTIVFLCARIFIEHCVFAGNYGSADIKKVFFRLRYLWVFLHECKLFRREYVSCPGWHFRSVFCRYLPTLSVVEFYNLHIYATYLFKWRLRLCFLGQPYSLFVA